MPPLLSLCFPTYSRAALLDGALRAALAQITPPLQEQVEVVILDNASPDDTPAVVARAQADFPHVALRHLRRPTNIGPDANFCDAPNQAAGEFLYLLSDDDLLLPGAVPTLLTLIQKHPGLDAFALNTRPFQHSVDEKTTGVYRLEADQELTGRDSALLCLGAHITFLSCLAFRRANVLGRDYTPRFATNLAQAYMFLDALAPGHGMYVTAQTYLAQRTDNNEGFDFFKVFVTHFHDLLRHAEEIGYAPTAVRRLLTRHLRFIGYAISVFKSKGAIGTIRPNYWDGLARLWHVYGPHPILLGVIVPMMLMPRFVYAALFPQMYALFRRVRAGRGGVGARTALPPAARRAG